MIKQKIKPETTAKMAQLSNLPVDKKQEEYFTKQFNETLAAVDVLEEVKTEKTPGTFNVTGLKNVFRKDIIEREKVLSQDEALSNAKKKHEGYFVVDAIFDDILAN